MISNHPKIHNLSGNFADDCTISEVIPPPFMQTSLQQTANHIDAWSKENRLQLKPTNCREIRSCFKGNPPSLSLVELNDFQLERISAAKILGGMILSGTTTLVLSPLKLQSDGIS